MENIAFGSLSSVKAVPSSSIIVAKMIHTHLSVSLGEMMGLASWYIYKIGPWLGFHL
jgi:hypothetical protein